MAGLTSLLFILAVCGTEALSWDIGDPCHFNNHSWIFDPYGYRAPGRYYNVTLCDATLRYQWYRVKSSAGDLMARQCVKRGECGTTNPVWLAGSLPLPHEGIVSRNVCLTFAGLCCYQRKQIQIRNCGQYMLYKLSPTGFCASAYCFRGSLPTPEARGNATEPHSDLQNTTQPWMWRNATAPHWGRQNTTQPWVWRNTTRFSWDRQNTTMPWTWRNATAPHWVRQNTTQPWGRRNISQPWMWRNTTKPHWGGPNSEPRTFPLGGRSSEPPMWRTTKTFPWGGRSSEPPMWRTTKTFPWGRRNITVPRGSPPASTAKPFTDQPIISDVNPDLVKLTDELKSIQAWVAVGTICFVLLVASLVGVILWQRRGRPMSDIPGKYSTFKQ
ncbi:uncharacterized protein LOC135461346 [Liolophura sinensis]|uniref:uncharacterized protein LOC135461346 n=1 Tax=Liolophura sinensis TaxID=3198878 RepID=UPI003157F6F5